MPERYAVGGLLLDAGARTVMLDAETVELSRKEFDMLQLLCRRVGQVVTRRELLAEVWQQPYGGSDRTVDVHLSWLRRKLGESAAQPRYLHSVRGVGVRLVDPGVRPRGLMRSRISWLVAATTSAVVISFVVPLCLLVRVLAEDRAMAAADQEARNVAILVSTLDNDPQLPALVEGHRRARVRPDLADPRGRPDPRSARSRARWTDPAVRAARAGEATTVKDSDGGAGGAACRGGRRHRGGGQPGQPGTVAQRRDTRLGEHHRCSGLALLALALLVADRLGRRISRPLSGSPGRPIDSAAGGWTLARR